MLTQCVNCRFYVRQDEEFCLNCGIKNPSQPFSEDLSQPTTMSKILQSVYFKIAFSLFLVFLFLLAAADGNFSALPYLRGYVLFGAWILGLGSSFVIFYFLSGFPFHRINRRERIRNSLASTKKVIDKRLAELDRRVQGIDLISSRIDKNPSAQLENVRAKLLAARVIVTSQFARYEIQKRKIELVRLQNNVSPYLFGLQLLNEFKTEDGLVTIENTQAEIDKIRQNLISYAAIEFPEQTLLEKQNFLSQLDETETSCQRLREALLSRQAARALQDISPIEENFKMPDEQELAHAAEVFNIQTALTIFSESFDELEHEYKRLKAEEGIGRKLLKN